MHGRGIETDLLLCFAHGGAREVRIRWLEPSARERHLGRVFGELRSALCEEYGQSFGAIHERDEHGGGDGVRRKMLLQSQAALRIEAQEAPIGEFMPGLRALE